MRRLRGTGTIFKRGRVYWAAYYHNGVQVRESTHKAIKEEAKAWLNARLKELQTGEYDPAQRGITVADLMKTALLDYETNGKKSVDDAKARWAKHLEPFFSHYAALKITTDSVRLYTAKRQEEHAADATINRELALLKRAFNLGRQSTPPKVRVVPFIPMLKENNTRTGFLEPAQYSTLADACTKRGVWLRAIFECGYTWGWRVSELLGLKVNQVDFIHGVVRLLPGTTKNREGRHAYMSDAISKLLVACCADKKAHDYLFTKFGDRRVRDFRGAWAESCKDAGVPGLLFHDLRRTAVRNMVRAGIPERVAMQISGHKTRVVFDRYNIVSTTDLKEAARKLEVNATPDKAQLHAQSEETTGTMQPN